jgi:signal transduction histidine kinase
VVTEPQDNSVAAIGRIGVVPMLLDVVCRMTGMGFAAIARVTDEKWIACAVDDRIGFGLQPGGELELCTTLCDEIRGHGQPILIDHVATDPVYSGHHTPARYGFQSYISMPIFRGDGSFFGTLCAIDPNPGNVTDPRVSGTFRLFAELIAMHLDTQARLELSEAALEAERETAALRDRFVAVLGHDLRNPLAAIEAGTRLLSTADLTEREIMILGQMAGSTRRMAQLIDDVLDLARGRVGRGIALESAEDAGLAAAIEQVVGELRAVHPGRALHLDIEIGTPVACDHQRIMQLVSNLLGNALTHGDPAQPVRLGAYVQGAAFRIEVANGGAPIPAEMLPTLFDPFTHSGNAKSLGLGLFIAMQIAKAHGGGIEVASDSTETRFVFTMPCEALIAAQ